MALIDRWEALPDWCSAARAADFLGVSKGVLINMVKSGAVIGWRTSPNGNWRISKDSLAKAAGLLPLFEQEARHGSE